MQKIIVKKSELLKVLKANRAEHRAVFEEACKGYRDMVIKELDDMLAEAKKGKRIRRSVSLIEPVDYTREYDRAIRIMEMETREEIELNETEFTSYVMDDWAWKGQFTHSNATYSARLQKE